MLEHRNHATSGRQQGVGSQWGVLVVARQDVRVDLQGDADVGVTDSLRLLDGWLVGAHGATAATVREGACHRGARRRIHSSRPSASAGMRPNPVMQSMTVCASDA